MLTGGRPATGAGARLVRLARLSTSLAAATDVAEVVRIVCADVADAVGLDHADLAFVRNRSLVSVQGEWPLPTDFRERYHVTPLDAHLPTTEAVRTGQVVHVEDLVAYQDGHPALQADVVASGFRSAAVAPLHDERGAVLGVLGLVSLEPVVFGDDLVATIALAGELVGAALRRTELGSRTVALAALASRLAVSLSTTEVAEAVRDLAPASVGAGFVNCRIYDPRRRALVAAADADLPTHLVPKYELVRLDAGVPLSDAARLREPVWLDDVDAIERRYPQIAGDAADAGFVAMAALPMSDSRGGLLGVLAVAWTQRADRDPVFQSTIQTVVELTAQALERAAAYDAEHELVTTIQRRLLGNIAAPSGLDVAARYLPAARTAGIGGDWFDVVTRGDVITAVIGDVAGHGIDAVAAMTQARTAVTGAVRAGVPLETLLDHADQMLEEPDRVIATVAVVELSTTAHRLRYTAAGHPWALLRRRTGEVVALDGSQQPPLGAPRAPEEPAQLAFGPGDTVVLYTDGMVERRDEPVTDSIDRLARALSACDPTAGAEGVVEQLLEAAGPRAAAEDDAAVLVLLVPEPDTGD